jgi:glucose-1-phosphate cytidylyltransferase
MKHYAHYGFKEFVIALGYKGDVVKRYFLDYPRLNDCLTIDLASGHIESHQQNAEDWRIHLMDTGLHTNKGGRIRRLQAMLGQEPFMLTYGDGVSDVDLPKLLQFHHTRQRLVTLTAVRPPARFGGLSFSGDLVSEFIEKPQIGEGWINGGFMVCEPGLFNYLSGDETSLETEVLEQLAQEGQLAAYRHESFWQCMDTLRDVHLLEKMWQNDRPPWRVWEPK